MSDGDFCDFCRCYEVHHECGVGRCLGPGPKYDCPKECLKYVKKT